MTDNLQSHSILRIIFFMITLVFFLLMGLGIFQSLSSYHRLPPINSHYMPEIQSLINNEDYGTVIPQLELANAIDPSDIAKNKASITKICVVAAQALIETGQFKDAILQYEKAYAVNPKSTDVLNNLAWLLATCHDKALRDGPRAVKLAKQAKQTTNHTDASVLDTLAAAYAESGNFDHAVHTQREAIRLSNPKLRPALNRRLKLYLNSKPYQAMADTPDS